MFSNKSYELPLSPDYVRHWGMKEGVREILQNAIDSDSPFEYEFDGDKLFVMSRFATLKPSTLILGATSKAGAPDKIGSFGEGYKIALLVLTRCGYPVKVHNGDRLWVPAFRESKKFESEVLMIDDFPAEQLREGITFEINGLSPDDISEIKESCLYMQDHVGSLMTVEQGRILREKKGKLYVGSLYVCDTDLSFGYDVKPEYLRLERDRQTVSGFDLKWLVKEMWFKSERWDEIAKLTEEGVKDFEYAEHGAPELVKEACYRHFLAKNPGKVLVRSQDELDRLIKKGMTNVVYASSASYGSIVTSSHTYRNTAQALPMKNGVQERLDSWLEANKKHMRRTAIAAFGELVTAASNWSAK